MSDFGKNCTQLSKVRRVKFGQMDNYCVRVTLCRPTGAAPFVGLYCNSTDSLIGLTMQSSNDKPLLIATTLSRIQTAAYRPAGTNPDDPSILKQD